MPDSDGWIKLWRKIQNSNMYQNLNAVQRDVMINCLLLANHKPQKWEWQGELFECEPGQFITSLASLQEVCAKDVTTQNIRTAVSKLEKWNFLTNESTNTGRLITIENWGKYQGSLNETNKANNKELTKHQQSTNKELTTNKNVKNVKNVKNDKEVKDHSPAEEKPDIPYKKIVDYLNEKAERSFSHKTDNTQKLIRGRFDDGYKIKDFIEVIDKKTQDWLHKNNDKDMSKYLRPDTLFRPANFENYLNEPWPNNNSNNNSQGKRIIDRYEKAVREEEGYINEEAGGS